MTSRLFRDVIIVWPACAPCLWDALDFSVALVVPSPPPTLLGWPSGPWCVHWKMFRLQPLLAHNNGGGGGAVARIHVLRNRSDGMVERESKQKRSNRNICHISRFSGSI